MTSWTAVLVAASMLLPTTALAHRGQGAPCPGGRFLLQDTARLGRAPSLDAGLPLELSPDDVSIEGTCDGGSVRLLDRHDATLVRARWRRCGGLGHVALVARIAAPGCDEMRGTFRLAGGRGRRFTAMRSRCGDGVYDAPRETCDAGLGCAAASHCTPTCACASDVEESPPASTTTTLGPIPNQTTTTSEPTPTTTTTSTMTTTTTTVQPPACDEEHPAYEGRLHVPEGQTVDYVHNPPSSGNHWPVWLRYERYTTPMRREYWVHNLEHGAIVIVYRPDAAPAVVDALDDVWDAIPNDPPCDHKRAVMTPDPLLDQEFAVVAQGVVLNCDRPDPVRIMQFVADHRNHGRETICNQGSRP